jgi:hypothetical protein
MGSGRCHVEEGGYSGVTQWQDEGEEISVVGQSPICLSGHVCCCWICRHVPTFVGGRGARLCSRDGAVREGRCLGGGGGGGGGGGRRGRGSSSNKRIRQQLARDVGSVVEADAR